MTYHVIRGVPPTLFFAQCIKLTRVRFDLGGWWDPSSLYWNHEKKSHVLRDGHRSWFPNSCLLLYSPPAQNMCYQWYLLLLFGTQLCDPSSSENLVVELSPELYQHPYEWNGQTTGGECSATEWRWGATARGRRGKASIRGTSFHYLNIEIHQLAQILLHFCLNSD